MSIEMTVTIDVDRKGQLVAPVGLSTAAATCSRVSVTGADFERRHAPSLAQDVLVLTPTADQVVFTYGFEARQARYPDIMFAPHDSRFTRCHPDLADEACDVVAQGGVEAMIARVTALFEYGHTDDKFYDHADAMPHLCDITTGSCVDINAYLIAGLRAARVEVGYVTGYFIPEERHDHTTDMHCWVVTRQAGVIRHWDIAHHLKMGTRDIAPALNPKPGVRVAMAHSMGWTVPGIPFADFKLVGEPTWFDADGWSRANGRFELSGYSLLDMSQNGHVPA